jgi:hypothetical protein
MFLNGDQDTPMFFAVRLGGESASDDKDGGFSSIRENVAPSDNNEKDTTKNGEDS